MCSLLLTDDCVSKCMRVVVCVDVLSYPGSLFIGVESWWIRIPQISAPTCKTKNKKERGQEMRCYQSELSFCPRGNTNSCCSSERSCENTMTNTVWLLTHFSRCCQEAPTTPSDMHLPLQQHKTQYNTLWEVKSHRLCIPIFLRKGLPHPQRKWKSCFCRNYVAGQVEIIRSYDCLSHLLCKNIY